MKLNLHCSLEKKKKFQSYLSLQNLYKIEPKYNLIIIRCHEIYFPLNYTKSRKLVSSPPLICQALLMKHTLMHQAR